MRFETFGGHGDPAGDLRRLLGVAARPGLLVVTVQPAPATSLPWRELERWGRSRAVTVADVEGAVAGAAVELALNCDLVYLRPAALLELPPAAETPGPGLVWAAGRAGRRALTRVLLHPQPIAAEEAVDLGLADAVVAAGAPLPLPPSPSVAALTAARDLVRARGRGRPGAALELASFRLILATGDPAEGARAFLERREPEFNSKFEN